MWCDRRFSPSLRRGLSESVAFEFYRQQTPTTLRRALVAGCRTGPAFLGSSRAVVVIGKSLTGTHSEHTMLPWRRHRCDCVRGHGTRSRRLRLKRYVRGPRKMASGRQIIKRPPLVATLHGASGRTLSFLGFGAAWRPQVSTQDRRNPLSARPIVLRCALPRAAAALRCAQERS